VGVSHWQDSHCVAATVEFVCFCAVAVWEFAGVLDRTCRVDKESPQPAQEQGEPFAAQQQRQLATCSPNVNSAEVVIRARKPGVVCPIPWLKIAQMTSNTLAQLAHRFRNRGDFAGRTNIETEWTRKEKSSWVGNL